MVETTVPHFTQRQKQLVFFLLLAILCVVFTSLITLNKIQNKQAFTTTSEAKSLILITPIPPVSATPTPLPPDGIIAYAVPMGTVGNQCHGGPLGMDFNVTQDIKITHLGVFDSNQDGLNRAITVGVFNRTTQQLLRFVTFNPGEGSLIAGSRFKELDTPIIISAATGLFPGSIVAQGYSQQIPSGGCEQPEERNGNSLGYQPLWTVNNGAGPNPGTGMITFVGNSRFSMLSSYGTMPNRPLLFPTTIDTGPVNRYAAGTFIFKPL